RCARPRMLPLRRRRRSQSPSSANSRRADCMRLFSKEATRYAFLLICLFATAAMAVWHVLAYLGDRLDPHDYAVIATSGCIITFGFMLRAGACGLWGMQLGGVEKTRGGMGHLVDAMDYIQDGLIALARRGGLRGVNPAVKRITGTEAETNQNLADVFPCL